MTIFSDYGIGLGPSEVGYWPRKVYDIFYQALFSNQMNFLLNP